MLPQVWLMGLFLLSGLLMVLVALPLVAGQVPRNYLYGFRTGKTLSSDPLWYAANRYAGRQLFWGGLTTAVGSLLVLPFAARLSLDGTALIGLAVTLMPLGIAVVRSFRYLRTL